MNEVETAILDCNSRYYHMDTIQLMENAGRSVAEEIEKIYGDNKKIGIFCGLGNNGGDGFVAARFLSERNDVTVYLVGTLQNIQSKEALKNWNILRYTAVNQEFIKDTKDISIPPYDIIVDALLGTGITGTLREPYKTVVETLNSCPGTKVAVDIPTGYKTAVSFAAECTISMHYPKTDDCIPVTIGVPQKIESLVGPGDVKFLNRRKKDSHKGDNGRVLIVGGSHIYHGAPIYAGLAASMLVDLVYVACPQPVASIIKGSTPDIIVHSLSADFLVPEDIPCIMDVASSCDSVLVGPGLGTHKETLKACRDLFPRLKQKVVVDADGLKALKGHTDLLCDTMVLTPHKNEYAMLFGTQPVEEAATATIVQKGPTDIISNGLKTKYNYTGNAGMTTGGTGDILAGLIAGFAAVNHIFQASCAGAFVSGKAGDICYDTYGVYYTASDVVRTLQDVLLYCETF